MSEIIYVHIDDGSPVRQPNAREAERLGGMRPVRVFTEDEVRPLWEAAWEVYGDSGMWKQLRAPLRDFPAPKEWTNNA